MSTLGPQYINKTYEGLLQVPGGVTSTLKDVQDGNGVATGLQVSTSGINAVQAFNVGPTITGLPGSAADVENVGSITNPILQFTVPAGSSGLTVTTAAMLRAVSSPATQGTAQTLGSLNKDDGGGGVWYWDAASSAPDNVGTVLLPTGHVGNGRWLRDYSGNVNARWFGAQGDGVTDDQAALQAAIDFVSSTLAKPLLNSPLTQDIILEIPNGTYLLESKIVVYSGCNIQGGGWTTILQTSAGYTDDCIIEIGAAGNKVQACSVDNICFTNAVSNDAWGIKDASDWVLNSNFTNLFFRIPYGICLSGYPQYCLLENIYSNGAIEQLIYLSGNENKISRIDKEGLTGSNALPYIHLYACSGVILDWVTLEGAGSVNKSRIVVEGCGEITFRNFWLESNSVAEYGTYGIEILGTRVVYFVDPFHGLSGSTKLNIQNTKLVHIASADASDLTEVYTSINIDDRSTLVIEDVFLRDIQGQFTQIPNIQIKRTNSDNIYTGHSVQTGTISSASTTECVLSAGSASDDFYNGMVIVSGSIKATISDYNGTSKTVTFAAPMNVAYTPTAAFTIYQQHVGYVSYAENVGWKSENLFANPSFEREDTGWIISGSPTVAYVQSEVGSGLMAHVTKSPAATVHQLLQTITVNAAQVGTPLTVFMMCRLGAGTTGIVQIIVYGCGISSFPDRNGQYSDQWSEISATFVPQSAGTLMVGVRSIGAEEYYLDNLCLNWGSSSLASMDKFSEIMLGNKRHVYASSAPATGVWSVGDVVWNSAPAAGGTMGWVCTSIGPVVWKTFGAIAA